MLRPLIYTLLTLVTAVWASPYGAIVSDGQRLIIVELAISPQEHARGYMWRRYLPPNTGILFIFPEEQPLNFWMKNTWQPLDMRFYDRAGRLLKRYARAEPCRQRRCPGYPSEGRALMVLETRARTRMQLAAPRLKFIKFFSGTTVAF